MRANEFLNEEKVRLDPKCWSGKKIGNPKTKMKGGVRVNNCVPAESQELNEFFVRDGDDVMSVMSLNLFADLLGQGNLVDYDEEFANSPKWQAVVAEWQPKAEYLQQQLTKLHNAGRKLRDAEADALEATVYDGSDAYESADMAASYLPQLYKKQASAIVRLLKDGYANPPTGMHESKELNEEFDLIESIIEGLAERNGVDAEAIWEDLESLDDDELYVFATTTPVMEDWQKANKKDKTDGMSQKAVNAYRREHPGSKLKTAVTTKPSKLKKGSKASKRRKSYCSRSRGQMKMHNISCAKTPDKAICKARRRWNCE